MEQSIKDYLKPTERFAERMKRSLKNDDAAEGGDVVAEQQHLFTQDAQVQLLNDGTKKVNASDDGNSPRGADTAQS